MSAVRLLILSLVLGAAACGSPPPTVDLKPPKRTIRAEDYPRLLARWTRKQVLLRQLDTTLRVHATLRAPEFDAAFVAKLGQLFKLPRRRIDALERERAAEWAKHFPLVLVVATHDLKWNDLDRKGSHWRVALVNDRGEQVDAERIVLARRTTANDRALFPQLKLFHRLYHVRFPRKLPDGRPLVRAATRKLVLRVTGALGTAELEWRLR